MTAVAYTNAQAIKQCRATIHLQEHRVFRYSREHDRRMSAWVESDAPGGEAAVDANLIRMADAQDELAAALRRLANFSSRAIGRELEERAEGLERMAQENRAGFAARV